MTGGLRFPRPRKTQPVSQTLCFIRQGDHILLQFRRFPPNAGYWNCPGGKVEPWETPGEACIREVYEETGLHVFTPRLRGIITVPEGQLGDRNVRLFVYEATDFSGTLRESREGMLEWLPERYLWDETEILPDIPVLFRELVDSPEVVDARLTPASTSSPSPRLIPAIPRIV